MAAAGFYRIALGVEYKGSRYCGWQRQASGVLTVQETLEKALSRVADSPVSLMCAGRTDAGVHAIAMCCWIRQLLINDGPTRMAGHMRLTRPLCRISSWR